MPCLPGQGCPAAGGQRHCRARLGLSPARMRRCPRCSLVAAPLQGHVQAAHRKPASLAAKASEGPACWELYHYHARTLQRAAAPAACLALTGLGMLRQKGFFPETQPGKGTPARGYGRAAAARCWLRACACGACAPRWLSDASWGAASPLRGQPCSGAAGARPAQRAQRYHRAAPAAVRLLPGDGRGRGHCFCCMLGWKNHETRERGPSQGDKGRGGGRRSCAAAGRGRAGRRHFAALRFVAAALFKHAAGDTR